MAATRGELAAGRYEVEEALELLGRALAGSDGRRRGGQDPRESLQDVRASLRPQGFRRSLERALELGPGSRRAAAIYAQLA